jgi:uncharacterized membrane protein YjfL (UPF0719 family)
MGAIRVLVLLSGAAACYICLTMNRKNLITIVSLAILVGTEILGAALALGWAIGSTYELPDMWRYGLIAVLMAGGAYTVWRFLLLAVKIEPIFDRK